MSNVPLTNLALQERTRRELLQKTDLIPSLPEIVTEILSLANDPAAEPLDFEECLQSDQGLVAKMLQVVNSPFYGLARPITSIRESVMVLGFRSLRSLVLAASTSKFLGADYTVYGHDSRGLWLHALAVAAGARTLAGITNQSSEDREEIFVAGLLHDIGKVLLASYLHESNADGKNVEIVDLLGERRIIGIDHQEAGALVARKWNLSPLVVHVVEHHHEGECPEEYRLALAIVKLSDGFARELGAGYLPGARKKVTYEPETLDCLGIDEDGWEQATQAMRDAIESALHTLSKFGS